MAVQISRAKGQFTGKGKGAAHCKIWIFSAISCVKTGEPIEMPFGRRTWVDSRNHFRWDAHWYNLMNTIEPGMRGGVAALSNYFDHLFLNDTIFFHFQGQR